MLYLVSAWQRRIREIHMRNLTILMVIHGIFYIAFLAHIHYCKKSQENQEHTRIEFNPEISVG